MAEFPVLGQKAPDFWRDQLKTYIDDADAAAAASGPPAPVDSVNGDVGVVTVNEVPPSGSAGDLLTDTGAGYEWAPLDTSNLVQSAAIDSIAPMSQAAYDALVFKDPAVLYVIVG